METAWKAIDIGVNLFCPQFAGREEEIIADAGSAGIGVILTGGDPETSARSLAFAEGRDGVFATAGIHPHDADGGGVDAIRALLASFHPAAIGECGLDYDRMYSTRENQLAVFDALLGLSEETNLPLFLHERAAHRDFIDLLKAHPSCAERAVVHCFTGTAEEALRCLRIGCCIGVTGWVCDERRNQDLLEALKVIPADRLMAETDAPYLLPRGLRLKNPNLPVYLPHVIRRLAQEKGMEEEAMQELLLATTLRFFSLPSIGGTPALC